MSPAARPARDVIVIGGGCYGTFYTQQLLKALDAGAFACRKIVVVDQDVACRAATEVGRDSRVETVVTAWADFLDAWLAGEAADGDAIVPSPLMPHLMQHWLLREAARRYPAVTFAQVPVAEAGRTPFDQLANDGARYLSHADWICPTHCIEPATCPAISAPRTWQMSETVAALARRLGARAVTFQCVHRTFGVGMYEAGAAAAALVSLAALEPERRAGRLLVSTVSHCHGACGLIEWTVPRQEPAVVI